ncbi:MAG: SDR family oxidoreductase [Chloroflexota bacterium]|nr:SDR family oxidoreductase [Chloroflexota bacterium]MDE2857371.1 SDR family oxidoreductase [Chloroflexota bacterium]
MSQSLRGKVAIITGASSGIGEATARLLSQQGCKLALAARSHEKLAALTAELPTECLAVRADMTQPADITGMVKRTLERFGRVDILLANAGIWIRGQFAAGDLDDFSELLKINVDAVLRCAHAVIPGMKARGAGDIIVTSSISGHHDLHGEPIYSASKNAVQTIVHTLRRQLAPAGIRVMSLAPGPVANPMQGLWDPEEIRRATETDRDYLSSDDCAEAILFMLTRPPHVTIRDLVMLPQIDRV